jgi:hypothetical protein
MKTLILVALVALFSVACSGAPDPEPPKPELACTALVSFDIHVSGCASSGCWSTLDCNRAPESTDYMGPDVKCTVDAEVSNRFLCRW